MNYKWQWRITEINKLLTNRHRKWYNYGRIGFGCDAMPFFSWNNAAITNILISGFIATKLTIAIVHLLFPVSPNCCTALIHMSSACSFSPTSLFHSDSTASFKLWHILVLNTSLSASPSHGQSKVSADKMQQKQWPSDSKPQLMCTWWMRCSNVLGRPLLVHWTLFV